MSENTNDSFAEPDIPEHGPTKHQPSPTPEAVAAAIERIRGVLTALADQGIEPGAVVLADLALLTQRLAEYEQRCGDLSDKLVDAGALHLADEQTIRNLEQRLAAVEVLIGAARDYRSLWRVVYENDPHPPTTEDRVQIGYRRGALFAAILALDHPELLHRDTTEG